MQMQRERASIPNVGLVIRSLDDLEPFGGFKTVNSMLVTKC